MAERAARGRDARLGAIRAVLYEDASRQTCSGTRGACSSTRHSLDSTRLAVRQRNRPRGSSGGKETRTSEDTVTHLGCSEQSEGSRRGEGTLKGRGQGSLAGPWGEREGRTVGADR